MVNVLRHSGTLRHKSELLRSGEALGSGTFLYINAWNEVFTSQVHLQVNFSRVTLSRTDCMVWRKTINAFHFEVEWALRLSGFIQPIRDSQHRRH